MFRKRRIKREILINIWKNISNDDRILKLFDMRGIDSDRITFVIDHDEIKIGLSTELRAFPSQNEFEPCIITDKKDLPINETNVIQVYRLIKLTLFELLLLSDINYKTEIGSTEFVNDLFALYKEDKNDDIDIFDIEVFVMYLKLNKSISKDTFNKLSEKRKAVQNKLTSDNASEEIDKYVQDTIKELDSIINNLK